MARKGWAELSNGYRKRLVSGGVTRRQYEAGTSLRRARGHMDEMPPCSLTGPIQPGYEWMVRRG